MADEASEHSPPRVLSSLTKRQQVTNKAERSCMEQPGPMTCDHGAPHSEGVAGGVGWWWGVQQGGERLTEVLKEESVGRLI